MNAIAIPLTDATDNKVELENRLREFSANYPGNFFIIQDADKGDKATISWIPTGMVEFYLNQRILGTLPFSVPMNWPTTVK